MKITILCVGKLKEKYWVDAVNEYMKRLSRYCSIVIDELKEERCKENASLSDEKTVIYVEGQNIIKHFKKGALHIALDLKGESIFSEALAEKIETFSIEGTSHIVFIIGGSLGLSKEVLDSVDMKLSFSKMTFPHQMIRVFLLEQIYRSYKIIKKETYHK